jgi:uncharacterized RDD family membrane protein YckC
MEDTRWSEPIVKRRGHDLAALPSRLGAALLDALLIVPACLPALGVILALGPQAQSLGIATALCGAGVLVLCQWVLLAVSGQTLGKKAARIRIVRYEDGGDPGFGRAVSLRSIVPGLVGAIPIIGTFFALVDILMIFGGEHRCLHDKIAHTIVVRA